MIVKKAVNMAKMMNVPVLGLVENMSYFTCPDCGKQLEIFGSSKVAALAMENGIPSIARASHRSGVRPPCGCRLGRTDRNGRLCRRHETDRNLTGNQQILNPCAERSFALRLFEIAL